MRGAILACVFALVAYPAQAADAKKTDQELFQGVWEVVKSEQEGKESPGFVKDRSPTVAYKGGKYVFKAKGLGDEVGEFKLGPKAKPPTLDYTITEGAHKGTKQLGIYKLEGDTLTICLAEEGAKVRPSSFKTRAGAPEYAMFVMKRKK
jgi:uncharacterized protein (TIGR03067 family)